MSPMQQPMAAPRAGSLAEPLSGVALPQALKSVSAKCAGFSGQANLRGKKWIGIFPARALQDGDGIGWLILLPLVPIVGTFIVVLYTILRSNAAGKRLHPSCDAPAGSTCDHW